MRGISLEGVRVSLMHSFLVLGGALLLLLSGSAAYAQGGAGSQGGAVPATLPPASGAPASNAAPADSSKPLPWKFLASPMGVLDPKGWPPEAFAHFGNADYWDCKKFPADCTPTQIRNLVSQTVGVALGGPTAPSAGDKKNKTKPTKSRSAYVVIHVVDYASATGNSLKDSWYLYSEDKNWSFQKFTSQRIYGSPTVLFLFVHLNAKGLSAPTADDRLKSSMLTDDDKAAIDAIKRNRGIPGKPDLNDPNKAVPETPVCADDTETHFQWLGTGAVTSDYMKVHYESAVVKRTPANVSNLLDILKILGLAARGAGKACKQVKTESVAVWGAGSVTNIGLPSDVSIAGYSRGKDEAFPEEDRSKLQIGAMGAFNDEQLYWWDASIGIPVHKIKDLQYSSSDNTVVASQVDKQSAYAMFNLMLHPVDLSDAKSNVWPRLLAGFPLASDPWDRLFAGGGIGIPLKPLQHFQFFAGATFNRSKQPATLTAGSMASNAQLQNDLHIKFTPKFTFGINVPVKSVLDKLLK